MKLEPRHFGALSGRGLVFIKLRDLDRALSAFEEVLEVDPQRMGARANIAAIRKLLGQREIRCNSLPPLGGERKSSCVQTLLYTTPRVCHGSDTLTCGPSVNATLTVTVDPEPTFADGRYIPDSDFGLLPQIAMSGLGRISIADALSVRDSGKSGCTWCAF